jgi:hypothetical protein
MGQELNVLVMAAASIDTALEMLLVSQTRPIT